MTHANAVEGSERWRGSRWLAVAVVGLVCVRVAGVMWAAVGNTHGDYYASLPGTYVRTLNPVLWNSADMEGAMGFQLDTYYHGPTQYLTLYPLAYLDSYAQIASVLLAVYAVVLAGAFWCLYVGISRLAPRQPLAVPLFASTFLFFPLLQAYLQREFEVVVFFGLAAALALLLSDRRIAAAGVLGYVAWFKYIPLLFAGYLALRGWLKATMVFGAVSIVVLGITHAVFGLSGFVNNNVPDHAAQVLALWDYGYWVDAAGELHGSGFCQGWFESETTLANVRHGLCAIGARTGWLQPHLAYWLLCLAIAAAYLTTHARLSRVARLSDSDENWRRALEFSIVTTVCACFFFAHYYYLIVLAIPFNVLLARYVSGRAWSLLGLWGLSYFLISAFLVPTGVLSRALGTDVWAVYMGGSWFLYGELLLMALLLREYWDLGRCATRDAAA